jgi:hypothetical protein
MTLARWSFSNGSKASGKVVGWKNDRLKVKKELHGEVVYNYLKPERLDNWEQIKGDVDNEGNFESSNGGFNPMDYPAWSVNDDSQWLAVKKNGMELSSHDTHKELKNEYGVGHVEGVDHDEYDYRLYFAPSEVE